MFMSSKKSSGKTAKIDWKSVGRRVRELRGFDQTQLEVADRMGISQGYLSTIEQGQGEIGAQVLLTISQEFGKSIEWLLTGED
jgi:transcriptional regulator with XRE-family HTH domain